MFLAGGLLCGRAQALLHGARLAAGAPCLLVEVSGARFYATSSKPPAKKDPPPSPKQRIPVHEPTSRPGAPAAKKDPTPPPSSKPKIPANEPTRTVTPSPPKQAPPKTPTSTPAPKITPTQSTKDINKRTTTDAPSVKYHIQTTPKSSQSTKPTAKLAPPTSPPKTSTTAPAKTTEVPAKKLTTKQKEREAMKRKLNKEKERKRKADALVKARTMKEKERNAKVAEKLNENKEKDKQKRAEKEGRPKKALSAYLFFAHETRPSVTKEGMKIGDVAKAVAAKWNALSADDKQKYEEMHEKDKARFDKAVAEYNKAHPRPPKKATTPYIVFVKEQHERFKADNPKARVTEILKMVAEKWKSLSAEQKKVYEQAAAASRANYEKDRAEFERNLEAKR